MPLSHHRKGWTPARSKPKSANPKRTKIRRTLRQRAAMMHAMLAAIGRSPIYDSRSWLLGRGGSSEEHWARMAKAWLSANQKRYAVA